MFGLGSTKALRYNEKRLSDCCHELVSFLLHLFYVSLPFLFFFFLTLSSKDSEQTKKIFILIFYQKITLNGFFTLQYSDDDCVEAVQYMDDDVWRKTHSKASSVLHACIYTLWRCFDGSYASTYAYTYMYSRYVFLNYCRILFQQSCFHFHQKTRFYINTNYCVHDDWGSRHSSKVFTRFCFVFRPFQCVRWVQVVTVLHFWL